MVNSWFKAVFLGEGLHKTLVLDNFAFAQNPIRLVTAMLTVLFFLFFEKFKL